MDVSRADGASDIREGEAKVIVQGSSGRSLAFSHVCN
jgi:hypothetical protein